MLLNGPKAQQQQESLISDSIWSVLEKVK